MMRAPRDQAARASDPQITGAVQPRARRAQIGSGSSSTLSAVFIGREDLIGAVVRALSRPGQGIVLEGPRRIGKTALLQHLVLALPELAEHRTVYFDLQDRAEQPLDDLLFDLVAVIASALDLPEPTCGPDVGPWIRDTWLPKVLGKLPPGVSLVLLIDEMDAAARPAENQAGAAFYPYLQKLLRVHAPALRVVLALGRHAGDHDGVAGALFQGLANVRVSMLSRADAETMIRAPGPPSWSDEAVDEAWALTAGHPLLLNALASHVRAHSAQEHTVAKADVGAAVEPTLGRNRSAFEWIWKGLSPAARAVAASLAPAGPEGMTEDALLDALRENGARVIIPALRAAPEALAGADLLESPAPGRYRFRVELLRRLVARYKPPANAHHDLDLIDPAAEDLYREAEAAHRAGSLSAAKARLTEALDRNPNHGRAAELLADVLIARKDWAAARTVLEQLYESRPTAARARLLQVLLALAEAAPGEDAQLALYERVRQIDERNTRALGAIERLNAARAARPRPPAVVPRPPRTPDPSPKPPPAQVAPPAPPALPPPVPRPSALPPVPHASVSAMPAVIPPRSPVPPALGFDEAYRRAIEALGAGDLEGGKQLLGAALAQRPDHRDALSKLYAIVIGLDAAALGRALDGEKSARVAAEGKLAALAAERDQLAADLRAAQSDKRGAAPPAVAEANLALTRSLDLERKARLSAEARIQALTGERDRLLDRLRQEHQPAVVVGADPAVLERSLEAERKARATVEVRLGVLMAERDKAVADEHAAKAERDRLESALQAMALERDQFAADLDARDRPSLTSRAPVSARVVKAPEKAAPALEPVLEKAASEKAAPAPEKAAPVIEEEAKGEDAAVQAPSAPPPAPAPPKADPPKKKAPGVIAKYGPPLFALAGTLAIAAAFGMQTKRIEVSQTAVAFKEPGESRRIGTARILRIGKRRPPGKVTWVSEDPSVATVDGRGVITAVGGGKTRVEAHVGNATAMVEVSVAGPPHASDEPAAAPTATSVATAAPTTAPAAAPAAGGTCEGGQLDACVEQGRKLEKGEGGKRDPAAALALYQKACDGGSMKGCVEVGGVWEDGKTGAADARKAAALYQKACEAKEPSGCSRLGTMLETGAMGVMKDLARSFALHKQACDAADPDGCWHLGALYELGNGVPRDAPAAAENYKKACEGGRPAACASLANMYVNGSGKVAKDVVAGIALFDRSCDDKYEPACTVLALKYKAGEGVELDRKKSYAYFWKACQAGNRSACRIAPKPPE